VRLLGDSSHNSSDISRLSKKILTLKWRKRREIFGKNEDLILTKLTLKKERQFGFFGGKLFFLNQ
jgi:hypothetical protein